MYSINDSEAARKFCEIRSQVIELKKTFTVTHLVGGYLNDGSGPAVGATSWVERRPYITKRIYSHNPCCLSHALQDLEDNFQKICEAEFSTDVVPNSYYVEGFDVILSDDQEVEIELSCGT